MLVGRSRSLWVCNKVGNQASLPGLQFFYGLNVTSHLTFLLQSMMDCILQNHKLKEVFQFEHTQINKHRNIQLYKYTPRYFIQVTNEMYNFSILVKLPVLNPAMKQLSFLFTAKNYLTKTIAVWRSCVLHIFSLSAKMKMLHDVA